MADARPAHGHPWSTHYDDHGRPYYYNSISQESVWERPAEMGPPPPPAYPPPAYGAGFAYGSGFDVTPRGGHGYVGAHHNPTGYGMAGGPGFRGNWRPDAGGGGANPGPPIRKLKGGQEQGPDGANLFIFYLPSNMTTRDMYNLFSPFGNILSARIMVDRETGRSRGFGFVSYETPGAATEAIAQLDGFPIGSKRLKVQLKKPTDGQGPGAASAESSPVAASTAGAGAGASSGAGTSAGASNGAGAEAAGAPAAPAASGAADAAPAVAPSS